MTEQATPNASISWTWAEQLSTYRFWGLFWFCVLTIAGRGIVTLYLNLYLYTELDSPRSTMGMMTWISGLSYLPGFYVAWIISRRKTKSLLVLVGLLQVAGTLLMVLPGATFPIGVRFVGSALSGASTAAIILGVSAVLAGGLGGSQAFVVAWGAIGALNAGMSMTFPYFAGQVLERFGYSHLFWISVGLKFVGLLLLLPVRPALFSAPPPPRDHALTPTYQSPALVALGCIIPFYWLYWLYRAHGEVESLASSRHLLSPRGAVAVALVPFMSPVAMLLWQYAWLSAPAAVGVAFAPFLAPIVFKTLLEALNERAVEQGQPPPGSPLTVFLCGFLCFPAAMALVQSAINHSLTDA